MCMIASCEYCYRQSHLFIDTKMHSKLISLTGNLSSLSTILWSSFMWPLLNFHDAIAKHNLLPSLSFFSYLGFPSIFSTFFCLSNDMSTETAYHFLVHAVVFKFLFQLSIPEQSMGTGDDGTWPIASNNSAQCSQPFQRISRGAELLRLKKLQGRFLNPQL